MAPIFASIFAPMFAAIFRQLFAYLGGYRPPIFFFVGDLRGGAAEKTKSTVVVKETLQPKVLVFDKDGKPLARPKSNPSKKRNPSQ